MLFATDTGASHDDPSSRPAPRPLSASAAGPSAPVQHPRPPTSGSATASLVFGILGVLGGWCVFGIPCLLAVVFGHIGPGWPRRRAGGKGARPSRSPDWILGYLFVLPAVVITFIFFGIGIANTSEP